MTKEQPLCTLLLSPKLLIVPVHQLTAILLLPAFNATLENGG